MPSCRICAMPFVVANEDLQFYAKMDVPPPTLCVHCRERRRQAHVNQLHLFRRKCALSGKPIICCYPPESLFQVVDQEHWYSDQVENTDFGREVDFHRPFFDQFAELQRAAFRPALFTDFARDENSEYTNFAGRNKNCYLIFDSDENWDCYYGYSVNSSKNSVDCYRVENLELCYEAVDSRRCYGSAFLSNCENCTDSFFLNNCIGCKHCIGCSNLQQKEYFVFNEPVSRERFEEIRSGFASSATLESFKQQFAGFRLRFPQKWLRGFQNENVTGNYLTNCRGAYFCFDCRDGWDLRYVFQSFMELKDCMDIDQCGEGELLYECSNLGYSAFNVRFSHCSLNQVSDLTYCELCFNGCDNLFGCVGLKKKQFCILNRQYSKDDYRALVPQIIEHMKRTGEWGEHLPPSCAMAPYNLSVAQQFYPLTKEQALALGYQWREADAEELRPATAALPDSIEQTPDSVIREILSCNECRRSYKIIAQELAFHREARLALPRKCFNCRHQARHRSRAPRSLWECTCASCGSRFPAACDPQGPEKVCCEKCYLDSLN